jgi:hypothetical protein
MTLSNVLQSDQGEVGDSNIELFTFAARCMVQGDTGSLNSMGLSARDIPHLRQLSLSQVVAMSERGSDLHAYLKRARYESSRGELERALLKQGAPRELMMALFRMSTRRYSSERIRLGVVGPRGRPMTAHMESAVEQAIWRLWVTLADGHDPARLLNADSWLLIAKELPGSLRSAWSVIQQWARCEASLSVFRGDRIRLGIGSLTESECALRMKHGLEMP